MLAIVGWQNNSARPLPLGRRFHGAAHKDCKLKYEDARTIPVIFHNLSAYDSHIIIKQVSICVDWRIDLLPRTMEGYVFFTKDTSGSKVTLRFIDSGRFIDSSLEKLISYVDANKKTIVRTNPERFGHFGAQRLHLTSKDLFWRRDRHDYRITYDRPTEKRSYLMQSVVSRLLSSLLDCCLLYYAWVMA